MHAKTFDRFHKQRQADQQRGRHAGVREGERLDVAKVKEAWEGFGVNTKMAQARSLAEAYDIDGVPTIGIHGRYTTSPSMGGPRTASATTDTLIAQTAQDRLTAMDRRTFSLTRPACRRAGARGRCPERALAQRAAPVEGRDFFTLAKPRRRAGRRQDRGHRVLLVRLPALLRLRAGARAVDREAAGRTCTSAACRWASTRSRRRTSASTTRGRRWAWSSAMHDEDVHALPHPAQADQQPRRHARLRAGERTWTPPRCRRPGTASACRPAASRPSGSPTTTASTGRPRWASRAASRRSAARSSMLADHRLAGRPRPPRRLIRRARTLLAHSRSDATASVGCGRQRDQPGAERGRCSAASPVRAG